MNKTSAFPASPRATCSSTSQPLLTVLFGANEMVACSCSGHAWETVSRGGAEIAEMKPTLRLGCFA
jgi:hypothetical protein